MNLAKSVFVSAYLVLITGTSGVALWSLFQGGDIIAWAGVLLAAAPFMFVLAWITLIGNVARTSDRFPVIGALACLGAALSLWGYFRGAPVSAPALGTAAAAAFFIYSYWYSSFGRQPSEKLEVGATLPDLRLTGLDGSDVHPAAFIGKPTVWIFYRGNWCPLCMAQVRELADQYNELQALGVRVALVSPQPHHETLRLAGRFDVDFQFLTDEGCRAGRALGIFNGNGLPAGMQMLGYHSDTVMPTVIITDDANRILWAHETDNYRVRPEPDTYLSVLRDRGVVAA